MPAVRDFLETYISIRSAQHQVPGREIHYCLAQSFITDCYLLEAREEGGDAFVISAEPIGELGSADSATFNL